MPLKTGMSDNAVRTTGPETEGHPYFSTRKRTPNLNYKRKTHDDYIMDLMEEGRHGAVVIAVLQAGHQLTEFLHIQASEVGLPRLSRELTDIT